MNFNVQQNDLDFGTWLRLKILLYSIRIHINIQKTLDFLVSWEPLVISERLRLEIFSVLSAAEGVTEESPEKTCFFLLSLLGGIVDLDLFEFWSSVSICGSFWGVFSLPKDLGLL